MKDLAAHVEARDEVLRKIGRNLVNFQKMEAMLKFLNVQQAISGSLRDLASVVAKARKSVATQSMGQFAEAFIRSAYSNAQGSAQSPDPSDFSGSFSIRMDLAPELAAERKKALRSWTHSMRRCAPEFEMLKSVVEALREYQSEAARYLASGECLSELEKRIESV